MIIDFYHIDAFEAANYEPIWHKLREMGVEANMVAVPGKQNAAEAGWFDFERFCAYCAERKIAYTTHITPNATLAVTTQNASILQEYSCRVRLMYGPVIYPHAWALQPHSVKPFHAVLTHGKIYADRFSHWLPREQLPIIGYPRYDDYFSGKLQREIIRARWGVKQHLPVLAFMPTWGNNTGFDKFFPALMRLANQYQIVVRPHHCTIRLEPERMVLLQSSGVVILDNAFDLAEIYAGADVVIADVRSGGLFEACLCGVPAVGMVIDANEFPDWLTPNNINQMVQLCSEPATLESAIHEALASKTQSYFQYRWAEQHVAYRNGNAAQQAALALINIAEKQYHSRKTTNLLAQYL